MTATKTKVISEIVSLEAGLEAVLKELRALLKPKQAKKVAPKIRSDKKASTRRKRVAPIFRTVIP
jgi:hypothetical protein